MSECSSNWSRDTPAEAAQKSSLDAQGSEHRMEGAEALTPDPVLDAGDNIGAEAEPRTETAVGPETAQPSDRDDADVPPSGLGSSEDPDDSSAPVGARGGRPQADARGLDPLRDKRRGSAGLGERPTFGQPGRLTAGASSVSAVGGADGASRPSEVARPSQRGLAAPEWQSRGQNGPRIIAVANQKGGVGKTTTAVNFGAAAAELGHRVLIIDLDPQGNASTGLGINPRSLEASMYDVLLHDVPLDEAIEAAEVKNLFIAPANLDLAGAEIELVPAFSREMRLKNAINTVASDFDLVLIDCPPSLGLLTVNAFAAASEVMVPIQCEYYALEGLGQLMRNVDLVRRNLNADLELSAIVLVMYDARTNLSAQVAGEVREHFGPKVCRAVIPRNIRLSEAPSFGQPITVFDPSSRGAIAYRDLAKEVMGEPT